MTIPDMTTPSTKTLSLGAVVIGRNEGARLMACLLSLKVLCRTIVYVDSGSTDGSTTFARGIGVTVVELDRNTPFSAARARNEGFEALMSNQAPDLVQFVDGDCTVVGDWLKAGVEALSSDPSLGLVTGWRSEMHPDASIYNSMCEVEWHRPAGEIAVCGGDMMVRAKAFQVVGGFNPAVIAAEDDELCLRLAKAGWKLRRLPLAMTMHDANMTRFAQWWKRSVRNGHGFAQVGSMHPPHLRKEQRRVWLYGLTLPLVFLLGPILTIWLSLLALAAYAMSFARTAQGLTRGGMTAGLALKQAAFLTLSKFPNVLGMLTYHYRSWVGRNMQIIEYK